jgi:hypothetical protein
VSLIVRLSVFSFRFDVGSTFAYKEMCQAAILKRGTNMAKKTLKKAKKLEATKPLIRIG